MSGVRASQDPLVAGRIDGEGNAVQWVESPDGPLATEASIATVIAGLASILTELQAKYEGGAVEVSNLPATQPVSGTFWQATQPVSFTWSGLTDAQLRASAVPVSGPLTDTQLRASAVTINVPALTGWQSSQTSVGTSAVQLASSALASRRTIMIQALAGNGGTVYIGPTNGVTTSTGYQLAAGDSIALDLGPGANIYAIASAESQTVGVIEVA